MSDTINALIARPMGIDLVGNFQAQQNLALTQQQVQAAQLANQSNQLGLLGQQFRVNSFLNPNSPQVSLADLVAQRNGTGTAAANQLATVGGAPPPGNAPGQAPASQLAGVNVSGSVGASPSGGAAAQPSSSQLASLGVPGAPTSSLPPMGQSAGSRVIPISANNALAPLDGIAVSNPAAGQPLAPGTAPTAATHSAGMPEQGQFIGSKVSPEGAFQTLYGVPVPQGWAATIAFSKDPGADMKAAMEARRGRLEELFSSGDWNSAVNQAYSEGWIDPTHAVAAYDHPEMRAGFLQGLASPDAYQSALEKYSGQSIQFNPITGQHEVSPVSLQAKQDSAASTALGTSQGDLVNAKALAQARAQGTGQVHTQTVNVPGKDAQGNPISTPTLMTDAQAAAYANSNGGAAPPPRAADLMNPTAPMSGQDFATRVAQNESGGNPAAGQPQLPNGGGPASSATGGAQFTANTWLPLARAARPDLASAPDATVLALRNDSSPQGQALQAQVTQNYAQQNAAALQQAGMPVNAATLGLAHRFGPNGAVGLLNASPSAPIASVVSPNVLTANPDLRGRTVGDVTTGALQKYGVAPVNFGASPAALAASAPGAPAGNPVLSAPAAADLEISKSNTVAQNASDITSMQAYRTKAAEATDAAQKSNAVWDQIRVESPGFEHGSFADMVEGLKRNYGSLAAVFGAPMPESVANWEAFTKNTGALARSTAGQLSPKVGIQELQAVQSSLPSSTMSPQGISRIADQFEGLNDYQNAKTAAAANFRGNPAQFEAQFTNAVTPGAFIVARMPAADVSAFASTMNKTPEGRATLNRIVGGLNYAKSQGWLAAATPASSAQTAGAPGPAIDVSGASPLAAPAGAQ